MTLPRPKGRFVLFALLLVVTSFSARAEHGDPAESKEPDASIARKDDPSGGVKLTTAFQSDKSPEDFPEKSCVGGMLSRIKNEQGCHYLMVTAGHCFDYTRAGFSWALKNLRVGRLGVIKDPKVTRPKAYTPAAAGTADDIALVSFSMACERDDAEGLPTWSVADKDTLKEGLKPGEVCLLVGPSNFVPGIVRPMEDVLRPLVFVDTRGLKAAFEKEGVKIDEPTVGDSGTMVLLKNKVIGIGVAVPKSRDFGGMIANVGETTTAWLREGKQTFDAGHSLKK